jgi:hypothetical protein
MTLKLLPADTESQPYKEIMKTKELRTVMDKFLKSEVASNARVQVCLPNGEFYDLTGIQIIGK